LLRLHGSLHEGRLHMLHDDGRRPVLLLLKWRMPHEK
jgi:hypothetical protein